jgi:glucose/arabinose dehydrogenase
MGASRITQLLGLGLFAAGGFAAAARGQSTAIATVRIASGLEKPLWAGSPPGDERIFVAEQETATIRIVSGGLPQSPPYLDLAPLVLADTNERGLLGLAFDPDFASNGFLYVNYTRQPDGATMIVRYHALDASTADPDSAVVILGPIVQPQHNHNGGNVAFGPDGKLYVGMGDGGGSLDLGPGHADGGNAQSGDTLLGKILRLNADGSVPADNPFASPEDGFLDLIWDYGLRNPWRWSFDRETGDFWLGDVGENLHEELDFHPAGSAGRNFGWHCMESLECTGLDGCTCNGPALTPPVHEFGHDEGCAIIAGYVYRGAAIPSLHGTYFFGDYCTGRIWSLAWDGAQVTNLQERTSELTPPDGQAINLITTFGEDKDGELLIVDRDGEIYRIVPVITDPPVDAFSDLGGGLPGSKGIPKLAGEGTMVPGSPNQLTLSKADNYADSVLVISLVGDEMPFKGGLLKVVPVFHMLHFKIPTGGSLNLPFVGPQTMETGTSLYFQFAIEDHHATKHVALSNALRATLP